MLFEWVRKLTRQNLLVLVLVLLFTWSGSAALTLRAMQGGQTPNTFEEENRPKDCATKSSHASRRLALAACVNQGVTPPRVQPTQNEERIHHAQAVIETAIDLRNGIGCPLRC